MSKTHPTMNVFSVPTLLSTIEGHYSDYGVVFNSDDICLARDKQTGFHGRHPLNEPFRLEADHLLLFKSGHATYVCNLMKSEVRAGTVLAMSQNTIYSIKEVSADCRFDAVVFNPALLKDSPNTSHSQLFADRRRACAFVPPAAELQLLEQAFGLLVDVCQSATATDSSRTQALRLLVSMADDVRARVGDSEAAQQKSNAERIFSGFLKLVNADFASHRDLSYYADKLCISVNHLSTTVSTFSGLPPKQWIEQAVISEAKVLLRYSELSITQIADRLNFPSASFFCKYFHRIVGMTPKKYADFTNIS